jgi:hypothetical protein
MRRLTILVFPGVVLIGMLAGQTPGVAVETPWSIGQSQASWTQVQASGDKIAIANGLSLSGGTGQWTSQWHTWQGEVDAAEVAVRAAVAQFANQTIQVVVKGSETPYTDAGGTPHTWYGRCMIAIVDEHRWIMALRSGFSHIAWRTPRKRDTVHLLTSNDEGRTWNKLDRWFDGTPIAGMPYEDGETHSEPGLYRMPNGDLILQLWRTDYSTGTRQLRSTDHGKTWVTDIDRINVAGVTGAEGNRAIGTQDWFADPENPSHVYMAFEYFLYDEKAGCLLARSTDNGKSYTFLSWISPLGDQKDPDSRAAFEPAIEYVGNRTIVAVLRDIAGIGDPAGDRHTWQTVSTNMGVSFSPLVDISAKISGGIPNSLWQRARLYKEGNPYFQHNNPLDYARGEGRLWGFGIHSMGGGWGAGAHTRKPVVYWSDDNAQSWYGPQLLHGPMFPGTDTGYGDLKRRRDGTFVAATYYCPPDDLDTADVEQYTFGGQRAKMLVEADRDGDGNPDADSGWRELHNGSNVYAVSGLRASHWRLRLRLESNGPAGSPKIVQIKIWPR